MDYSEIVYRVAVDRKGKELGRILRIDDVRGKIVKKLEPHAIVLVSERFKDDIKVPLSLKIYIRTEGRYALFDISKDEFKQIVKEERILENEREGKGVYIPASPYTYGQGGYGYHQKNKSRKK